MDIGHGTDRKEPRCRVIIIIMLMNYTNETHDSLQNRRRIGRPRVIISHQDRHIIRPIHLCNRFATAVWTAKTNTRKDKQLNIWYHRPESFVFTWPMRPPSIERTYAKIASYGRTFPLSWTSTRIRLNRIRLFRIISIADLPVSDLILKLYVFSTCL